MLSVLCTRGLTYPCIAEEMQIVQNMLWSPEGTVFWVTKAAAAQASWAHGVSFFSVCVHTTFSYPQFWHLRGNLAVRKTSGLQDGYQEWVAQGRSVLAQRMCLWQYKVMWQYMVICTRLARATFFFVDVYAWSCTSAEAAWLCSCWCFPSLSSLDWTTP